MRYNQTVYKVTHNPIATWYWVPMVHLTALFVLLFCTVPKPQADTQADRPLLQQESIPNPFDLLPDSENFRKSPAAEPAGSEGADSQETESQETEATVADQQVAPTEQLSPAITPGLNSQAQGANNEDNTNTERDNTERADPAQVESTEAPNDFVVAQSPETPDEVLEKEYERALVIDIEGEIFGRFHYYLNNRLDLARKQNADLVLIRLTSPGGDMNMSLELARRLRDIDWATVIVFIPQEAISGGAIISLGADRIYMRSGALIGDAGPIRLGVRGFEHAEEKVVSYLAESLNDLAESQGRPGALAEAMADRNLVVLEATEISTGKRVFVSEKVAEEQPENYQIIQPVAETGRNRFLTLGAEKALRLGLAEGVFDSEQVLLDRLRCKQIEATRLNWVDRTVFTLNRPWLTALLLVIGLIGLYLELVAPGLSVAGLTSLLCFGVFFWSHFLGGTSNWLEVIMFALGVICLICELFVLPGFGVFGISGIVLVIASLVMASQDFVIPETATEWKSLQGNLLIVLGSVLGVLVLFFGQILLLDSLPGFSRFTLGAPQEVATNNSDTRAEGTTDVTSLMQAEKRSASVAIVGATGQSESDLRPSGKVIIDGQLLDVITEGDYVSAGLPIEIVKVEGNSITVRKISQ